jgi:hypothetical protein
MLFLTPISSSGLKGVSLSLSLSLSLFLLDLLVHDFLGMSAQRALNLTCEKHRTNLQRGKQDQREEEGEKDLKTRLQGKNICVRKNKKREPLLLLLVLLVPCLVCNLERKEAQIMKRQKGSSFLKKEIQNNHNPRKEVNQLHGKYER